GEWRRDSGAERAGRRVQRGTGTAETRAESTARSGQGSGSGSRAEAAGGDRPGRAVASGRTASAGQDRADRSCPGSPDAGLETGSEGRAGERMKKLSADQGQTDS